MLEIKDGIAEDLNLCLTFNKCIFVSYKSSDSITEDVIDSVVVYNGI